MELGGQGSSRLLKTECDSSVWVVDALPLLQKIALQKKHSKAIYKAAAIWYTFIDAISSRSFYEKVQQPVWGGVKRIA